MKSVKLKMASFISVLLFLIILIGLLPSLTLSASAETSPNFSISVYGRDGSLQSSPNSYYYDGTAHVYKWADVEKFVFDFDATDIPAAIDDNGNLYYSVSVDIEYLKAYKENNNFYQGGTIYLNSCYSARYDGENGNQDLIKYKPEFNIDKGLTMSSITGIQATVNEWGIYKFRIIINNIPAYSDYYIIEPTREVYSLPQPTMRIVSSDSSLRNAYEFTLLNEELYRYIDASKLIWYAKGTTTDGKIYALTRNDLTKTAFSDCSDALYDENEWKRTGLEFIFDDDGKFGKWEIWCEYQPEGSSTPLESKITQIETKIAFNKMIVVWIIVPLALAGIAVTIGICIYKAKREKVY